MQWWDAFWKWVDESQFRAGVASALVVAALLGLVALIPKLRRPLWDALKKAWSFIISIRITTTKRIEAAKSEAYDQGLNSFIAEIAAKAQSSSTTLGDLLVDCAPKPRRHDASQKSDSASAAHTDVAELVDSKGEGPEPAQAAQPMRPMGPEALNAITKGLRLFADASPLLRSAAEIEAPSTQAADLGTPTKQLENTQQTPTQPLAEWRLEYAPTINLIGSGPRWVFRLTNLADDVTPRRVKVVAKDDFVSFPSGAFWNQFEPLGAETFVAVPDKSGEKGALSCTVSWLEDGRTFTRDIKPSFKLALSQPGDAAQPHQNETTAPGEPRA